MRLTKVPEFIMFGVLENALSFLRKDFVESNTEEETYLYQILNGNFIEKYQFFEQAKQVFINNDEANPRFLEVHLMFNMQREGLPTIHLTLPMESYQNGGNGIGMDEGYMQNIVDKTTGKVTAVFTRRYQTTFNIVITSDNSNEVVLIHHVLKALLTSLTTSIHLAGLENMLLGGGDVQLGQYPFYTRAITASVQYETSVPNLFSQRIVKDLFVSAKAVQK